MDVECVFTRELAKESYMQANEEEILEAMRESVAHFLDVCPSASLVSIEELDFQATEGVTPQPYMRAIVSCENNPEDDLLKRQVSIIGDAEFFDNDVFPVKLLGPRYWVSDEVELSDDMVENAAEAESESRIDSIVDKLFRMFN